jgi:hypothetical protein
MEHTLDERKLWAALSDVFVDNETDYKAIARVAKHYPVETVEFALFRKVAPVCFYNGLTPAPPVCWYFDEEQLAADILRLMEKRNRQGRFGKCMSWVSGSLLKICYRREWKRIKAEIARLGA